MDQSILKPGDVIGKYQVVRCLGVGGMGEVQLVIHQQLHSYRALKLLRPDLVSRDPIFGERFLREARIASRIQHKNIIQVMDVENDTASGFFYIVMEYVNGNSLQDVLRAGKLSEGQAVHIISEVVNGLAAASELGLVHRDIKPANIMISQEGEVKLADLGIAKAADDDVSMTLTMDNTVVGTPAYSSPEQCSDAHDVDVRADIYSLGATLYEMVTSIPPFAGANTFDTIAHVLSDEPVRPRRLNPEISEELEALILRMMAKDREQRPQTIAELQELLKPFRAANADIPPELKGLIHERVEREVQARTSTVITAYRKRQKGERLISLSVLIALLAAGCIFFIYRSGRSQLEIRRWKAEAAKLENEKKELAAQVTSLKNQMERNRQNYLETIGKLEKTNQARELEIFQLKNMQSARPADPPARTEEPAPEKTEPAPKQAEKPSSADVSGPKEPGSPVLPASNIPVTIEERIVHVETRLKELRESPKSDPAPKMQVQIGKERYSFRQFQIQIRTEQLKRLRFQQRVRDRARLLRREGSFDEAKTRAVQEKFARHTKERTDWGYNEKDLKFAESLIADLRSKEVDPNLTVTDSTYSRYSGPLIMSVLSGRIQHAHRIMAVLLSRYADTAPLAQNKNLLQKTGTGSDAKAAEMILTSGGFDSMTEILLPVSNRRPFPQKLIEALLYLDHNVAERDKDGNTALHLAAGAGDQDIVMMLVALDADVNARNRRGETPLFAASRNGHKLIVQMLQKLGADPKLRNGEGKTAADFRTVGDFKLAVERGDTRKVAEILRNKQADPNTVFADGNTALHIACTKGNAAMIKTLLDAGADPNIRQVHNSKRTALQLSLSQPKKIDLDIVDLLLKHGADPNPGFNSWSLLMELCQGNWWVRKLSSQNDQIRLLRLLLSSKKIQLTGNYRGVECSYLCAALSWKRSSAFVSEFLKHIDRFSAGDPVLVYAIANDYPETVVREIIDKGADVNAVQPGYRLPREKRESRTSLWCAVEKKQPAIVKLLLSKGADPQWKNSAGKSITDIQTTPEIRRELRNAPRHAPAPQSPAPVQPSGDRNAAADPSGGERQRQNQEFKEKQSAAYQKFMRSKLRVYRNRGDREAVAKAFEQLDAAALQRLLAQNDISMADLSFVAGRLGSLLLTSPVPPAPAPLGRRSAEYIRSIRVGAVLASVIQFRTGSSGWDTRKIHEYLSFCFQNGYRFERTELMWPLMGQSPTSRLRNRKEQRNYLALVEFLLIHPESILLDRILQATVDNPRTTVENIVLRTVGFDDFPVWIEQLAIQKKLNAIDKTSSNLLDRIFLRSYALPNLTGEHLRCLETLTGAGFLYQVLTREDQDLIRAIRAGDLQAMEQAVKSGADPLKPYPALVNALWFASSDGVKYNPAIIRRLLELKVPVRPEKKSDSCKSPLAAAIDHSNRGIALLLISRGADLDDSSALEAACRRNDTDMADRLLKGGTRPGRGYSQATSPDGAMSKEKRYTSELLFTALENRAGQVAMMLLQKYEFQYSQRNADGKTLLEVADSDPALKPAADMIRRKIRKPARP